MPTATVPRPVSEPPAAATAPGAPEGGVREAFKPLFFDAVLPVGSYFVAHDAVHTSLVAAITISSAFSLARAVWTFARERRFNQLAILILVSNIAALAFGLSTGSARFLVAKDSGVSSVIAIGILVSVVRGRPMMSEGLLPFLTKGKADRAAAVERLRATARFHTLELRYSVVWGVVLLADCVARIVGAYTLAPSTMAWGSTVILVGAIVFASLLSGPVAAGPMTQMVDRAVAEQERPQGA